jgi:hypothetical protein
MSYGGHNYLLQNTSYGTTESSPYPAGERSAVLGNGMVYGLVRRRVELVSQARFVWKRLGSGPKPMASDSFTTAALAPVDNPVHLLARMELDIATAGNSYWVHARNRLWRLPPEDVSIVIGSESQSDNPAMAWDAEIIGYVYAPKDGSPPEVFAPGEVAHYRPEEDPDARFREQVLPELDVLLRVARRLTRDPVDAEDLVQDTLVRAYRGFDRFDG